MDLEQLPVIDWEQGRKAVGNRPELAKEFLLHIVKTLKQDLALINQTYAEHKLEQLLFQIHKLHGALCYCGLPRLKKTTAQLETDLKSNIMINLPSLLNQLNAETHLLLKHPALVQLTGLSEEV